LTDQTAVELGGTKNRVLDEVNIGATWPIRLNDCEWWL